MLRAGLIGLGMMGRHHARVLRNLEGVTLVGVADANGDPHGVSGDLDVTSTLDALLELELDYCVVATPTATHFNIGMKLAHAGVHMLVEKPVAQDSNEAAELSAAFDGAGLTAAVGHIERYNPAIQAARARIEAGELGDVLQVTTVRQGPFPGRIADVGVIKDLATHDIDLSAWTIQQSYADVSAHTVRASGRPHEDMVTCSTKFSGGAIGSHVVNWLSPFKERRTVITGQRGAFVADTLTADLTFYSNGVSRSNWSDLEQFRGVSEGDMIRYAIPKEEPLMLEHKAFRDRILGKESTIVTLEEGTTTLRVAEACLESSARLQAIDLSDNTSENVAL